MSSALPPDLLDHAGYNLSARMSRPFPLMCFIWINVALAVGQYVEFSDHGIKLWDHAESPTGYEQPVTLRMNTT
jgi:hypothetical protein